jgi:SPP1 gp7 family putative phage head morphogenesis protein
MRLFDRVRQYFGATTESPPTPPLDVTLSSSNRSATAGMSYYSWQNPDDVIRRKGMSEYKKMRNHTSVKPFLQQKKMDVISAGWRVDPASESPADTQVAEFITWNLTKLRGSFSMTLWELLSALDFGFSVSEKVYGIIEEDPWRGKIGLTRLATRDPENFELRTNEDGTLRDDGIYQLNPQKAMPRWKFLHYAYQSEFDNPYGTSDLRAVHEPYFAITQITRFWNMYLERFGIPTVTGKYPRSFTKPEQDKLKAIIESIQASTAITIPEELVIEFMEIAGNGERAFDRAIERHESRIARAFGFPEMTGLSNRGDRGSRALGEVQARGFLPVILLVVQDSEAGFNEQVIPELVRWNFTVNKLPKFNINDVSFEDSQGNVKLFYDGVANGTVRATDDDEIHIRELISFPPPGEPREMPKVEEDEDEDEDQDEDDNPRKFARKLSREPNAHEQKVDWFAIAEELDMSEAKAVVTASAIVRKIRDSLISNIAKRQIIQEKRISEIDKLDLRYKGDLHTSFKDFLRSQYERGQRTARRDLKRANFQSFQPLLPKEALEFFERKAIMLTGVESGRILKDVKQILFNAMKMGKSTRDTIYEIQRAFTPYFETGELVDGEVSTATRLETVIRTNSNEAFNAGRLQTFRDPDLEGFVKAVEYSAILDERTTDICRALDGKVFEIGDPALDQVTPPNHFNCRSTLVPVIEGEMYTRISDAQKRQGIDLIQEGFK